MQDDLGNRMKRYENTFRYYLPPRTPHILRVDGKSFSSLTKHFEKPFDETFIYWMNKTMLFLCEEIQGAKFGYCQSDEISILLTDYDSFTTEPWFGKNIQKMVSISASLATAAFNRAATDNLSRPLLDKPACFDSRVFTLPREEVTNSFLWRQRDCIRNSIQSYGQRLLGGEAIHGLNCNEVQEKLFQEKGFNWGEHVTIPNKRGRGCRRIFKDGDTRAYWTIDLNIPDFSKDRNYIEQYVHPDEENKDEEI